MNPEMSPTSLTPTSGKVELTSTYKIEQSSRQTAPLTVAKNVRTKA